MTVDLRRTHGELLWWWRTFSVLFAVLFLLKGQSFAAGSQHAPAAASFVACLAFGLSGVRAHRRYRVWKRARRNRVLEIERRARKQQRRWWGR